MGATGMVAVVFFTLGQMFSDGVRAYNDQDYRAATSAFSEVLADAPAESPYRPIALFWGARACACNGKPRRPDGDLDRLLEAHIDAATQRDAETLYRQVTGLDWIGTGLLSPEKTWKTVVERIKARDERFLPRCFTGPMLETLMGGLAREESWDELTAVAQMFLSHVDIDDTGKKATVTLNAEGADALSLVAVKKGKFWLFSEQADTPNAGKRSHKTPAADGRTQATDLQRLARIRQLMEAYVIDEGQMPESLEALRDFAPDFEAVSVSAHDKTPYRLSTPTRNVEQPVSPWVFPASSANGKRTLLAFGQVRVLEEEAFVALARKHGVRWSDVPLEDLADQEARELSQWIDDLGSQVFDTRTQAYRHLEEAGERARALLEAAQEHEDPEIAFQARTLLNAL